MVVDKKKKKIGYLFLQRKQNCEKNLWHIMETLKNYPLFFLLFLKPLP